jgi:hypothetical protein
MRELGEHRHVLGRPPALIGARRYFWYFAFHSSYGMP